MTGFKVYDNNYPHFITITAVEWMPLFLRPQYISIIVDSLKFCQQEKGMHIHAYVIMPDHLHLIVSGTNDLAQTIGLFKSFTSREIISLLKADNNRLFLWIAQDAARKADEGQNKIWQEGFHPEQIYSESFFDQKVRYIHDNPVRRKLVALPSHWLHSSAGFYYDDLESVIDIEPIEW